MIVPLVIGAVSLFGLYQYKKSKQGGPSLGASGVANALQAAPPPPRPGSEFATPAQPASNSTGSIAYHPPVTVPGFNTQLSYVAVPPAPSGTTYPAANTVTDPNIQKAHVAAWQAATPTPSNVYYYPGDVGKDGYGDLWAIVMARLGGSQFDANGKVIGTTKAISLTDVGKLNGIVSQKDFDIWLKAKKPLQLPLGGYNDVSGPIAHAMGTIR